MVVQISSSCPAGSLGVQRQLPEFVRGSVTHVFFIADNNLGPIMYDMAGKGYLPNAYENETTSPNKSYGSAEAFSR